MTSKNPGDAIMVDKNYMSGGDSLIPARYNNPATSGLTAEINKGENTLTLELKE